MRGAAIVALVLVAGGLLAHLLLTDPGYVAIRLGRSLFEATLPVFVLVTPAHVHDSLVGWFIVLVAAVLYGFRVLVVYADAGYFDWRFLRVVSEILAAHAAVDYNLRRAGKRKLATLLFLSHARSEGRSGRSLVGMMIDES